MAGVFQSSDVFGGYVTAPDGSVYQQTNHTLIQSGGFVQTWSDLTLISSGTGGQAVAASTGVNPNETSYSLYGHTIPLSVFGIGRIGGEIIAGPWVENGLASFCISFGVPADPSGSRDIREIAFDSEVVWSTNGASGVTTSAGGTFNTELFTFRFYQGTLTQLADTLESSHYGADAVAYRPQILIWFENLPLANTKFSKIPYVSAVIGDSSGDDVNYGEALERLAYSPWVGYTSAQFETSGVTDGLVSGGLIFAEQSEFLGTIQQFGRFYPSWDILQTDKLRVSDRGSTVAPDITLNKTRLMGKVVITRQEPNTAPRKLELSTIDPDADYTIVPSTSQRPIAPVAVTSSISSASAYLPAIMDSDTRTSIVTYANYFEEQARKKVSFTAMAYGLEIEPGDLVKLEDLGDDFQDEAFKIMETLHGANYVVECAAEAILKCSFDSNDPHIGNVKLLLGFEDVNNATGDPGFTDESPAAHGTATVESGAKISTGWSKFGSSSYLGNNTGSRVNVEDSLDWEISTSNSSQFTIECWVRHSGTTVGDEMLIAQFSSGAGFYLRSNGSGNGELEFAGKGGVTWSAATSGLTWVSNQVYAIAIEKDSSGKLRIYRDGVMVASTTPADSSIIHFASGLFIGNDASGGRSWNGYIDEFRITKGVARYASDSGYTVPTAAFPRT